MSSRHLRTETPPARRVAFVNARCPKCHGSGYEQITTKLKNPPPGGGWRISWRTCSCVTYGSSR